MWKALFQRERFGAAHSRPFGPLVLRVAPAPLLVGPAWPGLPSQARDLPYAPRFAGVRCSLLGVQLAALLRSPLGSPSAFPVALLLPVCFALARQVSRGRRWPTAGAASGNPGSRFGPFAARPGARSSAVSIPFRRGSPPARRRGRPPRFGASGGFRWSPPRAVIGLRPSLRAPARADAVALLRRPRRALASLAGAVFRRCRAPPRSAPVGWLPLVAPSGRLASEMPFLIPGGCPPPAGVAAGAELAAV